MKEEKAVVLGVIPCRYASTRLPGKPLVDIDGKPMIQHVYERCLTAKLLSAVVIATDDERIAAAVKSFGGQVMLTSPDHPNGTSRVAEAARKMNHDLVLNIQGDEPLISPECLDELITIMISDGESVCWTCSTPILDESKADNPSVVKVVADKNNNALYFSRSPIPFPRESASLPYMEHVGIYGFTRDFLQHYITLPPTPLSQRESLEQLVILEHGYKIRMIATHYPPLGPNVNTPEDLEEVRRIMAGQQRSTGKA
ncbi:MAG: 3-deoxy-manno-octulosonate cytidylyltransferase [Syntrophobacterales bacterium]|jgi:3-deoxy-manno-octulosonate cytidylyltransferase (CMP-KDO synthetase)|nr:3-deoxy-manno-octulosonate cytidylyltransferase [Syntrophobacterales bacterium]